MSLICTISGHKPAAPTIWNDNTHFARCRRCDADLIEQEGRWAPPPPWLRVVWKKREPEPEAPPAPSIDLRADEYTASLQDVERSGKERRARTRKPRPPLGTAERRNGTERRKPRKKQAIERE